LTGDLQFGLGLDAVKERLDRPPAPFAEFAWRSERSSPNLECFGRRLFAGPKHTGCTGSRQNISAYNRGMKGYRTPNIDHIANEGANFTDYYGQQSRTAGRPAFIAGPSPDAHWGLAKSACREGGKGCRTRTRGSPGCPCRMAAAGFNP
jgi:hypothetical protein